MGADSVDARDGSTTMVCIRYGGQDGSAVRCLGERCHRASGNDANFARAETGYDGWLRYAPITDRAARERYATLPAVVVALGDSPIVAAAQDELVRGIRGMLGRTLRAAKEVPAEGAIVLGTLRRVSRRCCPRSANCPSCRRTATGSKRSPSTARTTWSSPRRPTAASSTAPSRCCE